MGIIFDGPRKMNMIEAIKKLTDAYIIYIESAPDLRYARIKNRDEKSGESLLTYEKFLENDRQKNESELLDIRATADIIIENNGTLEDAQKKLLSSISSLT
jgi:dephospho-CoA kinase